MMGIAFFFIYKISNLHFSSRIKINSSTSNDNARGYIKDRNGYILAMSIKKDSLFANPQIIKEPEKVAAIISPIIAVPEKNIF